METILKITGMNCGACANHVTKALQAVDGVKIAAVDLNAGKAIVRDHDNTTVEAMINAVEVAGYGAQLKEEGAR